MKRRDKTTVRLKDEMRYTKYEYQLSRNGTYKKTLNSLGVDLKNKTILDLRAGPGAWEPVFFEYEPSNVVWFDMSKAFLSYAEEQLKDTKTCFVLGTLDYLPFKDDTFNFVFCRLSLYLAKDEKRTIREVDRVLKGEGYFYLDTHTWRRITKNYLFSKYFFPMLISPLLYGVIGRKIIPTAYQRKSFLLKELKKYFVIEKYEESKTNIKLLAKETLESNTKAKICFYALNTYPLLSGKNLGFTNGAELQQVLIGKELAKKGYDVSFVVFDHGQKPFEIIDGIKIYKAVPKGYVLSGIKSFYHAFKSVWNALKQANADIYYQRCAGRDTGFIALFCLLKRRKFVYGLASDKDVDGTFTKDAKLYERILYKFGLKLSDYIIAQSEYQRELLKTDYNLDSIVIKNPYPIEKVERSKSEPPIVLWVGTIKPEWKQPKLFLKLAKKIPDAKFQMVGGASANKQFYDKIKEEAERIPNLEFVGFVPYPDVNKYFENASILVNTSSVEGFSNTFLQAWVAHTPVVSLNVDPDEIICKYKLGFHSKRFEQMVEDVKTLLKDETLREERGMNGRKYVEREHDIKKIVKKYIRLFEEINE